MSNTIFPGSTLGIIGINRNGVAMIAAEIGRAHV